MSAQNNYPLARSRVDAYRKKEAIELFVSAYHSEIGFSTESNVLTDYYQAFNLYEESCNKGCLSAMYKLALCYETGTGVSEDIKKAKALYKQSADQNYPAALYRRDWIKNKCNSIRKNNTNLF